MPNYEQYANSIWQSQLIVLFIIGFGLALFAPVTVLKERKLRGWIICAWYLSLATVAAFYFLGGRGA